MTVWRIIFIEVGKMLIDTSITVAYKCSSCGSFEFFNLSLFMLLHSKKNSLACRCKKSDIAIVKNGARGYKISISCIGCGNEHEYVLERKEILIKEVNVLCCPQTGMEQCFIGKDQVVRARVDRLENELDKLIDAFGYDNYFKNTQVMFDSLNKVHDIAEKGNLLCECGNKDIELILLSDRIHLKCKKCYSSKEIYATSNEDLKEILVRREILLKDRFPDFDAGNIKAFLRKTDGR